MILSEHASARRKPDGNQLIKEGETSDVIAHFRRLWDSSVRKGHRHSILVVREGRPNLCFEAIWVLLQV